VDLGFIGASLLKKLLTEGTDYITILDNIGHRSKLISQTLMETSHARNRYKIIKVDLSKTSATTLNSFFKDQDTIYHFASTVGVRTVDNNPNHAIKSILNINANVFEAAAKSNKRIIYTSTSEIYGSSY